MHFKLQCILDSLKLKDVIFQKKIMFLTFIYAVGARHKTFTVRCTVFCRIMKNLNKLNYCVVLFRM